MRVLGAIVIASAIAASTALSGCYKPSVASCQYTCNASNDDACPSGLVCSTGMCVQTAGETCAPSGDAGRDAAHIGEAGCELGFTVSNVDPCTLPGAVGDWRIAAPSTFSTDSLTGTGGVPPIGSTSSVVETGGQMVAVVYVHTLGIDIGATLTVTGSRPLIVLVDDVAGIDGNLDFSAAISQCPSTPDRPGHPGGQGTKQGGGGGGGGGSLGIDTRFSNGAGAHGGEGGPNMGDVGGDAGPAGNPTQDTTLVPLVTGCPGGGGGNGNGANGALGGLGGGAIQISARNSISLAGQIRANGGGGQSSPTNGGGAGGGGGGGGILFEADIVTIGVSSFVCANGGGGGASELSEPGEDGRCTASVAHGAISGSGDGGDGESTSFGAGIGQTGAIGIGAGGGGGGVGIIRVNSPELHRNGNTSPFIVTQ